MLELLLLLLALTKLKLSLKTPMRAVTPGQTAVFYNGDICLGGGVINEIFKDN